MSEAVNENGYTVTLTERRLVAEGTMAFYFDKPPQFVFAPGQFVDLTLLQPSETDAEGNTRAFSIASAPQESTLMVATRLRDTAFNVNCNVCRSAQPSAWKGRSENWCCIPIRLARPYFCRAGSALHRSAACWCRRRCSNRHTA